MDRMRIGIPSLAEGIKHKLGQVSGPSCQFVGNTEARRMCQSEKFRLWEISDQMPQVLQQVIYEEKKEMEEENADYKRFERLTF